MQQNILAKQRLKSLKNIVIDFGRSVPVVSEDKGKLFKNLLWFMYFLKKQEIPHTTNLSYLRELWILIGNTTLPRQDKFKHEHYQRKLATKLLQPEFHIQTKVF